MPQKKRPEKIPDKIGKSRIRGGTKRSKAMIPSEEPAEVHPFINRILLDPFKWVGTTTLAAWKNQRRCIGIEISP
jgi:DNA modification methylase